MFYNPSNSYEYNDCVSHGACSVSPNISSMQEIMFILLRQIAYYLVKLKNFGIEKEKIVYDIMSELAFVDSLKDLSEAQILDIFSKHYINFIKTRKEYLKICKDNNTSCEDLKNILKLSPKSSLSSILKRGDKEYLNKYKKLGLNHKYFAEVLSGVIKSVCINWITLKEYGENGKFASDLVLNALNLLNSARVSPEKIKVYIDELAKIDIEILRRINELQIKNFGMITQTEVSNSTRPHKAVMVSGSNLHDLQILLDALKDEDIDVYTNGNLLIAHAFSKFSEYKNLKGHFGSDVFNTVLDFATFPGAILLTRNESQNIEYLYRGRLFTTDDIAAKGVVKIKDNDFSPLIKSALEAKGFAKGQQRDFELIGYNDAELEKQINKIIEKNPQKIYIIGFSNNSMHQMDYFKKFFAELPADSYVISFSYKPEIKNSLYINIGNDYSILYSILHKIVQKISIDSEKLIFFMTKCDTNSLSNIINLKNRGAKTVFLSDCPPLVINPSVLNAFTRMFKVNMITNPQDDMQKM